MPHQPSPTLRRKIADYCRTRLAPLLPPREVAWLEEHLLSLAERHEHPPRWGEGFNLRALSVDCGVDAAFLAAIRKDLVPVLSLIVREIPHPAWRPTRRASKPAKPTASASTRPAAKSAAQATSPTSPRKKPGVPARPIVEFPEATSPVFDEPTTFCEALDLQMSRHGDTAWSLHRAIVHKGGIFDRSTLAAWRRGAKVPRSLESMEILGRIERRYRLPEGHFKAKLPHPSRSPTGHDIAGISPSERRRIAWHLPDDFDRRPAREQEEILEWVRRVVVSGSTDYRRYQAAAMKTRFAIRFPTLAKAADFAARRPSIKVDRDEEIGADAGHDLELLSGTVPAPPRLVEEMATLLRFKTSTLTELGFRRNGVWNEETAMQKIEHIGLLFGALAASPRAAVQGLGVPLRNLTFGMLVFPAVWDWYVQWRERRRGFYTAWEVDMLRIALALTRRETGWLRQTPALIEGVREVPGLVSQRDIDEAKADWDAACDRFYSHGLARAKEIQRVARVHRDPFEPILPVLEADSPVGAYRKITDEIVRLMPDERRYPRAAAEAVRSFLLIRLGLHLGLRQKNLRQLLICPRGRLPTSERRLMDLKRGELRWSDREQGWEVFIPAVAFKNATSSFFGSKPFRLILPDLADLYRYIDDYVTRHRAALLAGTPDPGTFFVKTVKVSSRDASYDQNTFYEAWRLVIQRYGIYNPYTGRGAIEGLLPHGPHNVRDVLATHVLKITGSYEQASYAIQDTPEMVAKHYGRFLPQDKAALVAQILNKVWAAA